MNLIDSNFFIIIIFIFGLILGSFISVLSSRDLSQWKSILWGRSKCPKCHHELKWLELIPIVSYLIQKGRCANCKDNISLKYPLLEVFTAILLTTLFLQYGWDSLFGVNAILLVIFMAIVMCDLEEMIIPDHLLVLLIIPLAWLTYINPDWRSHLYGLLVYLGVIGILVLPTRGKWMGFGDLKLAPLLGWLIAYPLSIVGLYFSFLAGAVVGLLLIIWQKKSIKTQVPFGPFLILGYYVAIFYGDAIINWYQSLSISF